MKCSEWENSRYRAGKWFPRAGVGDKKAEGEGQ